MATNGPDTFRGDGTGNNLSGLGGDDTIYGLGGKDVIHGNGDRDRLFGGIGDDELFGDAGDDTLFIEAGNDILNGGTGYDIVDVRVARLVSIGEDQVAVQELAPTAGIEFVLQNRPVAFALPATATAQVVISADGVALPGQRSNLEQKTISEIEEFRLTGFSDSFIGFEQDLTINMRGGNDLMRAGAGAEFIIGGGGFDWVTYQNSTARVLVELFFGFGNGGFAAGDRLQGIEGVAGSVFNDELTAGNTAARLAGLRGSDTLIGGNDNDTLLGGEDGDTLLGGIGSDRLEGGAGNDTVSYATNAHSVVVKLGTGAAAGTGRELTTNTFPTFNLPAAQIASTDTLLGVESTLGSNHDDILVGNELANRLAGNNGRDLLRPGSLGNDTLEGGGGIDTADFLDVASGRRVEIDLVAGTGRQFGQAIANSQFVTIVLATYTLTTIENLRGSSGDDVLKGTKDANVLEGGDGNDRLVGLGQPDRLLGQRGSDTVDYSDSDVGVRVDLQTQTVANGDAKGDTLVSIENAIGSNRGNDVMFGSSEANRLAGLAGTDRLSGAGGDDTLDGGAGKDVLSGGTEDDVLIGGAGGDQLDGGTLGFDTASYAGAAARVTARMDTPAVNTGDAAGDSYVSVERLIGTAFDDTLAGNGGANTLNGGFGVDTLFGMGGIDHLFGEGGNDTLDGGRGNDTLNGGAGDDTLDGGANTDTADYTPAFATGLVVQPSDRVEVDLVAGIGNHLRLIGGRLVRTGSDSLISIENVRGSNAADVLKGDTGVNVLAGGDGNDVLNGRAGNDTLHGEGGTDTADYTDGLFVQLGGRVEVDLANGTGKVFGLELVNGQMQTVQTERDTLISIENARGSNGGDVLNGNTDANLLDGGAGFDTLDGEAGDDVLRGGTADDELRGGAGSDELDGGDGFDTLDGGAGNDVLRGGTGDDEFIGGAGGDQFDGGDGFDTVSYAGATSALIVRMSLPTFSTGEAFFDTFVSVERVIGTAFDDTLVGNGAANTLIGGFRKDTLEGGAGDDTLDGGPGNDLFIGGPGADVMEGGINIDTVDYSESLVRVVVDLNRQVQQANGSDAALDRLSGINNVIGSKHNDFLRGDEFRNKLSGGDGNDTLAGDPASGIEGTGASNDVLIGGRGDDFLRGHVGNDRMEGGVDDDNYGAIGIGQGDDRIFDSGGESDMLEFNIVEFLGNRKVGDDLVLDFEGGASVTIEKHYNRDADNAIDLVGLIFPEGGFLVVRASYHFDNIGPIFP